MAILRRRPTGQRTFISRTRELLVLLFFLMIPTALLHLGSELELEVIPGFAGFVKPNHWIPFRVNQDTMIFLLRLHS